MSGRRETPASQLEVRSPGEVQVDAVVKLMDQISEALRNGHLHVARFRLEQAAVQITQLELSGISLFRFRELQRQLDLVRKWYEAASQGEHPSAPVEAVRSSETKVLADTITQLLDLAQKDREAGRANLAQRTLQIADDRFASIPAPSTLEDTLIRNDLILRLTKERKLIQLAQKLAQSKPTVLVSQRPEHAAPTSTAAVDSTQYPSRLRMREAAPVTLRPAEVAGATPSDWDLLVNLIPLNRTQSESDDFWRRGIAQIRLHNVTLADELTRLDLPSLRPERRLAKLQDRINEEFFKLQRSGRAEEISRLKQLNDEHILSLIRPPNVRTMTLDEIVAELASFGFYTDQPRIPELQNAFEDRMNDVRESNQPERSRLINFAGVTNAAVNATSQKKDFSANVNKVIGPLLGKNVSMTTLALGYFFEGSTEKFTVTDAKEGRAVVNLRIIDVWEYIRRRIADKPEHGGINCAVSVVGGKYVDATGGYIPQLSGESNAEYQKRLREIKKKDQTFSYNTLNEEVVDDFNAQLRLIFKDIQPKLLDSFILFCQTFGVKSAGYMPWLMRGTTRGHGFKPEETETKDESRYINPFALRLYQATRYDRLTFARYLSIFLLVDKQVFLEIVRQNQPEKRDQAEEFYDLIDAYNKSKLGSTLPAWMVETRQLTTGQDPKIDLNRCIFPLLPEVFTSTLGADAERDILLADVNSGRITEDEFARRAASFVDKYKHQGYFPKYKRLIELTVPPDRNASYWRADWRPNWREALRLFRGKMQFFASGDPNDPSSNYDMNFYILARNAVEKMFDQFDKPLAMNQKADEIIKQVLDWNTSIIGKAKLTPGPHQQLFAPLTCQLITQLMYSYEFSGSVDKVNALYREIIDRLEDTEGLPQFSRLEVIRLFGGNVKKAPMYLVYASHEREKHRYKTLRKRHYTKYDYTFGARVKRAIPVDFGKKETPYEFEEVVSKETTTKDKT